MPTLSLLSLAFCFVGAFMAYLISLCVYRLYFHPLSEFPGPRLAAISSWYEIYYDVVKDGQYIWEIESMHKIFGPIVRINPHELHILDSNFFKELYVGSGAGKRTRKHPPWCKTFAAPASLIATVEHDVHQSRRAPLNPFFSLGAVRKLEPLIKTKVDILTSRLIDMVESPKTVRIDAALMALSMDIICAYCFGFDPNHLTNDDLAHAWKDSVAGSVAAGSMLRAFPLVADLCDNLPLSWMRAMDPGLGMLMQWKNDIKGIVRSVLESAKIQDDKAANRTIFHTLRDSSLPDCERTLGRLTDEALVLTGAGSETTSHTLTVLFVHLLENESCLKTLQQELDARMPEPTCLMSWQQLTQLPYLSAVIQESLRLSYGVTSRNPRIKSHAMPYGEWLIPAGTPVSQSAPFVLMDPGIFFEPERFNPDRWLGEEGRRLESYQIVFGRGSRACIGINLAYAELFLTTAALFRQLEFQLVGSSGEDVKLIRDHFTAAPANMHKGVYMQVLSKRG